ncbi:MAG: hypothetical protein IJF67_08750, partial [Clostridia bacterium]|nr:hypothetical protein [Clostridia bacterium]
VIFIDINGALFGQRAPASHLAAAVRRATTGRPYGIVGESGDGSANRLRREADSLPYGIGVRTVHSVHHQNP